MGSPFLQLPASEWVASNDLAFAIRDRYPVSPGHTLIIPRREVATWFDATAHEQHAIIDLIDRVNTLWTPSCTRTATTSVSMQARRQVKR
jgi:diadenosine tetraphosphate (Ap4A) HIT family hydrolase